MVGVDAGTATTHLHEPQRVNAARNRSEITGPEKSFRQGSFSAYRCFVIAVKDLPGYVCQILLTGLQYIMIQAIHCGGLATEDKRAIGKTTLDLRLEEVFG